MSDTFKDRIDVDQPALIVRYGNTNKKIRPLDGELLVLGRKPGCDMTLESPDVAPVHCLVYRTPAGWSLRDCSGRGGTRVNGKVIHEVLLEHEDVIQLGAFSFQVVLPPSAAPRLNPHVRAEKLARSRKRLVHLALKLRKRLGERKKVRDESRHLEAQRVEVAKQVELLASREKDYNLRMTRLELSERDLATDRATLDREYKAFVEESNAFEERRKSFEEQMARERKEWADKLAASRAEADTLRQQRPTRAEREALEKELHRLEELARTLDARAAELERSAPLCSDNGLQPPNRPVEMSGTLVATELVESLARRQQSLLETMLAELRQLRDQREQEHREELERLRQECERLRQLAGEEERRRCEAMLNLEERTQAAQQTLETLTAQLRELRRPGVRLSGVRKRSNNGGH